MGKNLRFPVQLLQEETRNHRKILSGRNLPDDPLPTLAMGWDTFYQVSPSPVQPWVEKGGFWARHDQQGPLLRRWPQLHSIHVLLVSPFPENHGVLQVGEDL